MCVSDFAYFLPPDEVASAASCLTLVSFQPSRAAFGETCERQKEKEIGRYFKGL